MKYRIPKEKIYDRLVTCNIQSQYIKSIAYSTNLIMVLRNIGVDVEIHYDNSFKSYIKVFKNLFKEWDNDDYIRIIPTIHFESKEDYAYFLLIKDTIM